MSASGYPGRPAKLKPPTAYKYRLHFQGKRPDDEIVDSSAFVATQVGRNPIVQSTPVDPALAGCSFRAESPVVNVTSEVAVVDVAVSTSARNDPPIVDIELPEDDLLLPPLRKRARRDTLAPR